VSVYAKLMSVQANLKAPKSNYNSFGKYSYRSCEDILEGLKPHLADVKAIVNLTDAIELIGDRYYIKATATFVDIETGEKVEVSAMAREDESLKGMSSAQVTGSVSSYARKYALNGMFCIDDTKDSDATNTHGKEDSSKTDLKGNTGTQSQTNTNGQETISEAQAKRIFAIGKGNTKAVKEVLLKHSYTESKAIKKADYEVICKEIEQVVS
jgi:hypothetical protein